MNDNNKIKIPVILGATAVGKTELALELAEKHDYEILSCDSRQIYSRMDIGTAKPTAEEQRRVRHHLIDILDPKDAYSAFAFAQDATRIILDAQNFGKKILICGGTGLYYHVLTGAYSAQTPNADMTLREELTREADKIGSAALHERLRNVNPEAAAKIHPNDLQRIIRALDVYYNDRKTEISENGQGSKISECEKKIEFLPVVLTRKRELLYDRINVRVNKMFGEGLYEEFLSLVNLGYTEKSPGLATPGYRELFDVLNGNSTREQAAELIKQNTRRYAKRQMTWFRNKIHAANIDADEKLSTFEEALFNR